MTVLPQFQSSKKLKIEIVAALFAALLLAPSATAKEVNIGGGTISGIYYQVAYHTCSLMNLHGSGADKCVGRPSLGSVFNINAVARDMLDFGIAQSDRVWQAVNGKGSWKRKAEKRFRTVFSLYPEIVLAIVHKNSDIKTIEDLKGRIVNIGNRGSGHLGNALDILRLYGLNPKSDIMAKGMRLDDVGSAFLNKEIDSFIYTIGVPNDAIDDVAEEANIRFLNINAPKIRKFVSSRDHYTMMKFDANLFNGTNAFESFAVKSVVVTGEDTSETLVYNYVKAVFDNLEDLKTRHPAFASLNPVDMVKGLGAPLHPGAEKYYREMGLLP